MKTSVVTIHEAKTHLSRLLHTLVWWLADDPALYLALVSNEAVFDSYGVRRIW